MALRIFEPDATEEDRQEKPSLEALLGHYEIDHTDRKRQMVHCPFHEDRTPSCSIDLTQQVYKCHSCGRGGDSYTLLMEKEGISFVAARALAASLGLTEGGADGGHGDVSESAYGFGRRVSRKQGDRPSNGRYVPAWRRQ